MADYAYILEDGLSSCNDQSCTIGTYVLTLASHISISKSSVFQVYVEVVIPTKFQQKFDDLNTEALVYLPAISVQCASELSLADLSL
jgi:hypothetical protein